MLPPPRNDDEFLIPPVDACPIQEGTVGWPDSPEVCELGKEAGDSVTLVRVTLFHGAPAGAPQAKDGLANGFQVAVRVASMGIWQVPPRGQRVIVTFPGNNWTPGNGVITSWVGKDPTSRFGRKKVVLDFGDNDVVIMSSSSVSLVCEDVSVPGKPHRYVMSVSADGGAQVVSDGSGLFALPGGEVQVKAVDAKGALRSCLMVDQDETSLIGMAPAGPALVRLSGGDVDIVGGAVTAKGNVFLGHAPVLLNPAVIIDAGGPVAGAAGPSASVFISKT